MNLYGVLKRSRIIQIAKPGYRFARQLGRRIRSLPSKTKLGLRYIFDYRLGQWSTERRRQRMPGRATLPGVRRLDLSGKRVLLIVAHCDDEVIFAGTVLTSQAPSKKGVVIVFDGQARNESMRHVAELAGAALTHLRYPETTDNSPGHRTAPVPETERIEADLRRIILSEPWDVVFTHNAFGEYGHAHHRFVHRCVSDIVRQERPETQLLYVGYSYASIFVNGRTPWPNTLRAFSVGGPWMPEREESVVPYAGALRSKHVDRYFYHDTNCYLPQLDRELLGTLRACYANTASWWMRPDSHYDIYCQSRVQYFYDPRQSRRPYAEYAPFRPKLTRMEPDVKKPGFVRGRASHIRSFMEDYLIDYLRFEGKVLWIGWNQFCRMRGYKADILRHADTMEILDDKPIRLDTSIYGDEVATYIGDICDLHDQIADGTFDCAHFFGVLEYVDDMANALREVLRITKPGGRILIGTPGVDYSATGHQRPTFEFVLSQVEQGGGWPIEVWRFFNPDFYCIHILKLD